LKQRLDEAMGRRAVTLLCTPAGFGKTTLLADWSGGTDRAVAWLSLDPEDNDPARFWRYLITALDRVCEGIGERVLPAAGGQGAVSSRGMVTALINEIADAPEEVVLVLDDYHAIESPLIHDDVGFLLTHLPHRLDVVITSRSDPPLPLARLRATGQLADLRAADLRLTAEESSVFLREVWGLDLPPEMIAELEARTEGWAVGLQLAALSLRERPDPGAFLESFSGSHRYVLDYLAEEVLERQSEQVRTFLLETSVLERLSGGLCDAVTGRMDGQAMLEAVERANLFLMPLDEVRGWWRYHQLFADLLRVRLQQQQPERVPRLHRAAANWFEANGLADEAVRHALASGEASWAARLAERHADALLLRGEGATVRRWLGALPAELVGSRPRLLLAQTRLALLGGRIEKVEDLLDAAERSFADTADEPYEPSTGRGVSLLSNVPATIALDRAYLAELHGHAERALALVSRARDELHEDEWMLHSNASGYLAVAEWLGGRPAEAERLLASTIERWLDAGYLPLALRGWHHLGQVQRAQGKLDAALATYTRALGMAAPRARAPLPGAGMAQVGMAEVAYQRGELDGALEQVSEGIERCRQLVYTPPLATGLATLACIRQAHGDPTGALAAIGEAERFAPSHGVTSLLNPIPALRARLLLVQGDLAGAARWTQARGLDPDDEPVYPREPEYLTLVRVLLAEDRPDRALPLLERLRAAAEVEGRLSSLIEILALRALALAGVGDEPGGLVVLADALGVARPEGYVRVFADEGPPMAALLRRLASGNRRGGPAVAAPARDQLNRVARAFGPLVGHGEPGRTAAVPLVEPLTGRELEVLRLIAAGKRNHEIAKELFVTLDTVKRHVTNILGKLGASSRVQAVTRARELELIS
jgi:LuxR family maltose regulon positive regulatory protein